MRAFLGQAQRRRWPRDKHRLRYGLVAVAIPVVLAGVVPVVAAGVAHLDVSFVITPPAAVIASATKVSTTTTAKKAASWRVMAVSSRVLKEVSGCAFSRRDATRVWLHNDSGDGAIVVPVDIRSGAVGAPVTLTGIDVVDPEDIAITTDGDVILADIGDNALTRKSVQLYRFREPAPTTTSTEVTRLELRYPDGPHNAEALFVSADGRAAFILTKEPTGVASVFRANLTATSPQVLANVGQITLAGEVGTKAGLVSAADAIGSTIVLRSYQSGYVLDAPSGTSITDALRVTPRRFSVPAMVQGEAICVSPDGRTLVTASESQGAANFALAIRPFPA